MPREISAVTLSSGLLVPDLTLAGGETVCIVGASNSGKSEYCIFDLGHPRLAEQSALAPPPDPHEIGYVPTTAQHLFSGIKPTLRGEIELSFQFLGLQIGHYTDLVEALGLIEKLEQDPFTLSGGEAVKAAIAIAAVKQPKHWILDQVYDGLAPQVRLIIRDFLKECLSTGASVLETHTRSPEWIKDCETSLFFVGAEKAILDHYENLKPADVPLSLLLPETQLRWVTEYGIRPPGVLPTEQNVSCDADVFHPDLASTGVGISANGVKFRYKRSGFSLGPIEISCEPGECVALIGPNGAGKTTTLRLMSGLLSAAEGSISVFGSTPTDSFSWATKILYCFQNPDDQLYLPLVKDELYRTSRILKRNAQDPTWIIDSLGLNELQTESPAESPLSTRRLITIASAFIASPPFIALDEPTVSLDPFQIAKLKSVIRKFNKEGGGIVLVSHDHDFVGEVATRVVDFEDGKVTSQYRPYDWPMQHAPFALQVSRDGDDATPSLETLLNIMYSRYGH